MDQLFYNVGPRVCDKIPALVAFAYSLDADDPRQGETRRRMLEQLCELRDLLKRHD